MCVQYVRTSVDRTSRVVSLFVSLQLTATHDWKVCKPVGGKTFSYSTLEIFSVFAIRNAFSSFK